MITLSKSLGAIFLLVLMSCGNSRVRKDDRRDTVMNVSSSIPLPGSIKIHNHSPVDSGATDPVMESKTHQDDEEISYGGFRKTPACVRTMIDRFSKEEVTNPPRKIYQYEYNGRIVFYVPALCCDFYSDLYDMDCQLIGHPDGGYTGRGDGSFSDFSKVRKKEKLIWEDKR